MTEIQDICSFSTKIEYNKLCFYCVANENIDLTELRITKAFNKIEELAKTLYLDEVKKAYFIFDINNLKIPTNFNQIEELALSLKKHEKILTKKLVFTVIQNNNNIFKIFFKLFKKYYSPIRPLYLSKDVEETQKCLHDKEARKSIPNVSDLLL